MRKFSSQSGITLVGLIFLLIILLALGGATLQGCMWVTRGSAAKAESELGEFAQQLGWDLLGKSCAGSDSDQDGYTSCTARIREDGSTKVESLECASGALFSWTKGCKLVYQLPKQQ